MRYGNTSVWRRIVASPFVLVVVLIMLAVLAKATWSIHRKAVLSAAKLSQAGTELAKLEAHKSDLERRVVYLSSEQGIEAELRTKYRAVKDGESVAVIVDNSQPAAAENVASSTLSVSSTTWWQKLRYRP